MQKRNLKFVLIYLAVVLTVMVFFLADIPIFSNEVFSGLFEKIIFTIPVLFIISAFLAFKIAETRIVLVSLSFLLLSVSSYFPEQEFESFFKLLPFFLGVSLSLLFILPERSGNNTLLPLKIILFLAPLVFFVLPDEFFPGLLKKFEYGGRVIPWPVIVAAILPAAGYGLYKDRRSGVFAAALTSALLLFMLPEIFNFSASFRELGRLIPGIIILHALYRVYWESSYVDELTGLFNRRALDERLRRLRKGYSLVMVDIDHFKNFNDTFGHDEGDNVLRLVARILYKHFRNSVFRYGGEEFCVIFKKTGVRIASGKMNDARAEIEANMFSIRKKTNTRKKSGRKKSQSRVRKVKLTVSAGVSAPGGNVQAVEDVLKVADKALYKAKENGRNRVEILKPR